MTMLEVILTAPWKVLDGKFEAAITSGQHFQNLQSCSDDFHANAITGNGGDFVFAHICLICQKPAW